MDFFTQQEQARKRSGLLIAYFVLAVALIILAIYGVCLLGFSQVSDSTGRSAAYPTSWWNPALFGSVAISVLVVVGLGSLFKILALAGGGSKVAESMGGRLLATDTTELKEKRLLNIVEEMAIASGVAVPPVYVMDREQGINAFAAGFSPNQAVVAVTQGTLDSLSRDELQGVMAHEFSHIVNGDMRMNIRLMGVLHGILVIALIGEVIFRSFGRSSHRRSRDDKGAGAIVLFGIALFVIGYVGVFFGRLIKSAVSRQREYLADASAVQFTRNPAGIAGALKKIGSATAGSRIENPRAEEASHLFFGNGMKTGMVGWWATHPPLAKRILAVEPDWDGEFKPLAPPPAETEAAKAATPSRPSPLPTIPGIPEILPGQDGALQIPILAALATNPDGIADLVGTPLQEQVEAAQQALHAIPEELSTAAHEPYGARAVMFLLLFDHQDEDIRVKQRERLKQGEDQAIWALAQELENAIRGLPVVSRFPLAGLCVSALRSLSPAQYRDFRSTVDQLIGADDEMDLFEYALSRSVLRPLDLHFGLTKPHRVDVYSVRGIVEDCNVILSLLAHYGHDTQEEAKEAFDAAIQHLDAAPERFQFLAPEHCGLELADQKLSNVQRTSMKVKKQLVTACLQASIADGSIRLDEAELFRAIAGSLDCPVPPWVLPSS